MLKDLIISILLISLILLGCGKQKPCNSDTPNLLFIGYDSSEIDTLIISKFERNSKFLIKKDSALISNSFNNYKIMGDSTQIFIGPTRGLITREFDWTITISQTKEIIEITNIATENKNQRCGGILSLDCFPCYSAIKAFSVNGIPEIITSDEATIVVKK